MSDNPDIIVIGGGIAGVSAACELALAGAAVLLLETEDQLAYHSTGRSAALLFQNYGPPKVRRLTTAGRRFFMAPPEGFSEHPLVAPRGVLTVAPSARRRPWQASWPTATGWRPSRWTRRLPRCRC